MKALIICCLAMFLGVGAYAQSKKDSAIGTSFSLKKKEWKDTASTLLTVVKKKHGWFKNFFKAEADATTTPAPVDDFLMRYRITHGMNDRDVAIRFMQGITFPNVIYTDIKCIVFNETGMIIKFQ